MFPTGQNTARREADPHAWFSEAVGALSQLALPETKEAEHTSPSVEPLEKLGFLQDVGPEAKSPS